MFAKKMEYCKWILIIGLLNQYLIYGQCKSLDSINKHHSENAADIDGDYYNGLQGDDDYDTYDEDENDKSGNGQSKTLEINHVHHDPPYFKVQQMDLEMNENENVTLPCDVENLNVNNVAMWFNGTQLITTGKSIIGHSNSDRLQILENNAIRISKLQITDSNNYTCRILPENIEFHIQLKVIQMPNIEIYSKNRHINNKQLLYRQGESVEFDCQIFGHDNAVLKWSLNGKRIDNVHSTHSKNAKIVINSIDAEHAGEYTCLGDIKNSNYKLPIGGFTVNVQYKPKASTHRHFVNTKPGEKTALECDYSADPIAIVEWKKNNQILSSYTEKYTIKNIQHNKRNRSILHIKNMDFSDLGEYTCHVQNSIGDAHVNVHVILEPETPYFEKIEINGQSVKIYWLVRSLQPLSEAIMDYMLNGTHNKWMTEAMRSTVKHPSTHGVWKLRHEVDLTNGLWSARVRTKNTIGWSQFSKQHDFYLPEDDNPNIESESAPDDIILKSGIGGGGSSNSNNAAKTSTASAAGYLTLLPFLKLVYGFTSIIIMPSLISRYLF